MMDRKRYPPNWEAISQRIRFDRAGGRCEQCGVLHGAIGYREADGTFVQLASSKADVGMSVETAALDGQKIVTIILTTAHVGVAYPDGRPGDKHDKMDCRDENLLALCQRCHLRLDIKEHMHNAAVTRRKKRVAAGQTELSL